MILNGQVRSKLSTFYITQHTFNCVELVLFLLIPIITYDYHLADKVLQSNYSNRFNNFGHHIYVSTLADSNALICGWSS